MLEKAGLGRLATEWKGNRDDIFSVGGKKSRDKNLWNDYKREIFESDKKRIIALLVEVLTNLVMSTHVYTFGGKYFL